MSLLIQRYLGDVGENRNGIALVLGLFSVILFLPLLLMDDGKELVLYFKHQATWNQVWTDIVQPSLDVACIGFLFLMPYLVRALKLSFFRPRTLSALIKRLSDEDELSDELIATVTEKHFTFDPDFPHFVPVLTSLVLAKSAVDFPCYIGVNGLEKEDRRQMLLASSALPFGVFPPVHLKGSEYVDGGISDNLPIFPVLDRGGVEELFVIRLRPTSVGSLKLAWKKADRLNRLRKLDSDEALQLRTEALGDHWNTEHLNPPRVLPFQEPTNWPSSIVEIAPFANLGGLISGTLNFTRKRSRELVSLGWADTRQALGNPNEVPEVFPRPGS